MQSQFISCRCRKTARRRALWATIIVQVAGGFMAFESAHDWRVWKNQK